MNVVDVEQLTKVYQTGLKRGNIVALNQVTLGIAQGEIFGLLGPNGAGKTSMMKILLGITRATSGDVAVMGLPPSEPASRERVGFLPENHRFPYHVTGVGLLELTGRMHGMPGPSMQQRIEELLPLVGMERWGNTKIRKYSKGMSQRIGLAQAMMPDPDLLLLDEPTDGVDPVGKIEIREVLKTNSVVREIRPPELALAVRSRVSCRPGGHTLQRSPGDGRHGEEPDPAPESI